MACSSLACFVTSDKCSCQQLYFLQIATLWKLQQKQVGGEMPDSELFFLRSGQYLQRDCLLFKLPL